MIDASKLEFAGIRPGTLLTDVYGDGETDISEGPHPANPIIEITMKPTAEALREIFRHTSGEDRFKPKDVEELYICIEEAWRGDANHVSAVLILKDEPDAECVYFSAESQDILLAAADGYIEDTERKSLAEKMDEIRTKYNLRDPKGDG